MKNFKIAFTADISESGSIHTKTFLRAVEYIKSYLEKECLDVELILVSDDACEEGAIKAAAEICHSGADVVIGHFASPAAKAALPFYEEAGIPLILPAATEDVLTSQSENVFRICAPDSAQAKCIHDFLMEFHTEKINVLGRGSQFHNLQNVISKIKMSQSDEVHTDGEFDVITGRYSEVVSILKNRNKSNPTVLSDDAFHLDLVDEFIDADYPIWVCGFSESCKHDLTGQPESVTWYKNVFGTEPGIYFKETIMAAQCVLSAFNLTFVTHDLSKSLDSYDHVTEYGKVKFINQENVNAKYSIWRLQKTGFSIAE